MSAVPTPTSVSTRMVCGVKNDDGGYAVWVRVGEAPVQVQMVPGSGPVVEGDSVLTFFSPLGNYALSLVQPVSPYVDAQTSVHLVLSARASASSAAETLSINLPAAVGGDGPVPTGFYAPAIVDFPCTVAALHLVCLDSAGKVTDDVSVNVRRTPAGSTTPDYLNGGSPLTGTGDSEYDFDVSGWDSVDISAHDLLELEVTSPIALTGRLAASLEVTRA